MAKRYSRHIRLAKDANEAQMITAEAQAARDDIRDAILHLNSLELLDKAEDLGLQRPFYSRNRELWEEGREPGTVHLTTQAQFELKQAIRNEQRNRWSVFTFVLKEIITPIVGVLGAIMGLLSVIHAFHSK